METFILPLGAGFAAAALIGVGMSLVFGQPEKAQVALLGLDEEESEVLRSAEPTAAPFSERARGGFSRFFGRIVDVIVPTHYARRISSQLRMTGANAKEQLPRFLFIQLLLFAVGVGLGVAAYKLLGGVTGTLALILAPVMGLIAPPAILSGRVQRRQKEISNMLPDFLDMLMISVEAGLGFDAALARIVATSKGPLSEEFARTLRELAGGISRKDAFRNLSERTGVPHLDAFLLAMLQADVFGVSVGNVLRVQSAEMRVRRRQDAEAAAQRAPALMTFPLIACILPATLIVLITPAILSIIAVFAAMGR